MFIGLSGPLGWLVVAVIGEIDEPGSRLGADPGEAVVLFLGIGAIRILLLTLCLSTLRRLFGAPRLIRFRRMVGLFAFTYVLLHFLSYLALLAEFDWKIIQEDLVKRTYITVGFTALLALVPLAVTSTNNWRRRLGSNWQRLHRLVYAIAGLGLLHYFWLTKDGYGEGLLYLVLFVLLMMERLFSAKKSIKLKRHAS